ncbi:hypothetical protein UFOVP388_40 [uncultured Caudovirales phage]|uniref:Uncharacterized protein n=1 Tax=uncultured Caudovirales phage TaxID=2100421 RepID=A0A6J7X9G6_9CAUD|nr:hypothetical protein UFOVP388_40 [uncultured Caudovirales phage]
MAETKIVNLEVNSNLEQTEKSVGSLKAQLRQAQSEVAALSDKFGATSKQAVEAAKRAGELKDKIGDAKALTDAFNPDAKFKALSASLGGVASGFAAYQGALGLAGIESKDLEKQLLKVQSAMAISQGLQSIGESVDSFKQLGAVIKNTSVAQKILTATTAAYTFVNNAATTGLKIFRIALIGTGIGALVVGVGLLIANFDKVKTAVMNLIPGLASVGEFVGGIVDSITDFVGATSDASRALDKLKKDADNTLAVNKKFMAEHGDQVDEYTKKKIDAKNAYAEAVKEDGADQVALAKRLNRELEAIEYSRGDKKRELQKQANEKAAAELKAHNEKVKQQAAADAEKEKEEKAKAIISEAEAFRNQLEAVQKIEVDAKKANADALLTEQELAIQNENEAYEIKKANAIKFGIDYQELEKQHLNTLNDINVDAANKKLANDKANADAAKAIAQAEATAKADALGSYGDALGSIGGMLGESTAAGKAASVASATISTYLSANKAYESQLAIPTPDAPFRAALAAGVAVASGLMNVQKILSVQTPGGGGGGGAAPTAPTQPAAPSFNVVGQSGASQIAQGINGREMAPIKTYVLGSDVSTQQSLNRKIVQNASIG